MWTSFRSLTSDESVKNQRLKPGTISRIARYANPYRGSLIFFLATVIVDAILVVTSPLLLKRLIDQGVIPSNSDVVTQMALLVGRVSVPVWLIFLSEQLPIIALVGFYPAN